MGRKAYDRQEQVKSYTHKKKKEKETSVEKKWLFNRATEFRLAIQMIIYLKKKKQTKQN